MPRHLTAAFSKPTVVAVFFSILFLLVLTGCQGVSSSNSSSKSTLVSTPNISSLSPSAAEIGASVIIAGSNFGSVPGSVTFNGIRAELTAWGDTAISATVPSGATTGNLLVTVSGLASNGVKFTVGALASDPTVTALSPLFGPVGTPVTITGTNFGSTAGTVMFNGTAASVGSWSDTSITTTVPSGATSGNVVVTVNGITSNGIGFSVGTSSSTPAITSLSPSSGTVGTAVTITGTDFGSAIGTVTFNGITASVGNWTNTSIATSVPSAATSGNVAVTVNGVTSNGAAFSVVTLPPSISSLAPSKGVVGALVTIAGTNFGLTAGTVTFNGTAAPIVKWTGSSITTKVPTGATSGIVEVSAGGNASNGVDFTVGAPAQGAITAAYFGMQCGVGYVPNANNCPDQTGTELPTWPTSVAQPGLWRLWDSQVSWSFLMSGYKAGVGSYNWAQLDGYLDVIAAHPGLAVNYVFGCVPSFIASGPIGTTPGSCGTGTPSGSASPPKDLTASGSPAFTQFVTDLMNHCSPAGNCVKDLITGYELWNEANVSSGTTPRWTGTQLQLYQMMAPAAAIIYAKVPNARILTPSITSGPKGSIPVNWMTTWIQTEVANGIISNYYNIHEYINNNPPENVANMWGGSIGPNTSTSGWTPVPWVMGETSWDDVALPYGCNDGNTGTLFSTADCIGQMVRWNLILMSNGSSGVYWYYWNTNIGQYSNYSTGFYYMMQYLDGGKFGGPCSSNAAGIWTCSFTEANGTGALWVWFPNETGTSYTVPSGYADYLDMTGAKTTVAGGSAISIGVQPILLEK